jgi:hypothetical protein
MPTSLKSIIFDGSVAMFVVTPRLILQRYANSGAYPSVLRGKQRLNPRIEQSHQIVWNDIVLSPIGAIYWDIASRK